MQTTNYIDQTIENTAKDEGITLSREHWLIINFLRDYYARTREVPTSYNLCMALNIDIYKYFPEGYTRQLLKIAGIPKPDGCFN